MWIVGPTWDVTTSKNLSWLDKWYCWIGTLMVKEGRMHSILKLSVVVPWLECRSPCSLVCKWCKNYTVLWQRSASSRAFNLWLYRRWWWWDSSFSTGSSWRNRRFPKSCHMCHCITNLASVLHLAVEINECLHLFDELTCNHGFTIKRMLDWWTKSPIIKLITSRSSTPIGYLLHQIP